MVNELSDSVSIGKNPVGTDAAADTAIDADLRIILKGVGQISIHHRINLPKSE